MDVILPTADGDEIEGESLGTNGFALRGRVFEEGWIHDGDGIADGRAGTIVGDLDPQFDFSGRAAHETNGHFVLGAVLDDEFGGYDGAG